MTVVRFLCAAWILPAGFSLIAFFGFFTNYTTDVFSRAGLAAQYERSVFRYRVLGRALVTTVSGWFGQASTAWPVPRAFTVLDPAGEPATYWAYVAVHTFFTCLGCSLLWLTLRRLTSAALVDLVVVTAGMLMALAAYVVTPYDGVFFAFQMAALMVTVTAASRAAAAPLAIVTVLAALTRETAYFIPAFFLAVHHRRILSGDAATRLALTASAAAAVVTYAGLRGALGWAGANSVFYAWQAPANAHWTSLAGTAMLLAALVLLLADGPHRSSRRWYAMVSVPYILFVHLFAAPWEWRLWIPIVVPMMALYALPDPDRTAAG